MKKYSAPKTPTRRSAMLRPSLIFSCWVMGPLRAASRPKSTSQSLAMGEGDVAVEVVRTSLSSPSSLAPRYELDCATAWGNTRQSSR